MAMGVTFFIVAALVISVWVIIEFKRLKHKLLAMFLIALIIFTYVGFSISLKNNDTDLKTIPGVLDAGKIYLAWLSGLFGNFRTITAYAFKQDWQTQDENILNKTIPPLNESFWDKI